MVIYNSRGKVLYLSTLHSNQRAHHCSGRQHSYSASSQNSQSPFIPPPLIHSPTIVVPVAYDVIDGPSRNSPARFFVLVYFYLHLPFTVVTTKNS